MYARRIKHYDMSNNSKSGKTTQNSSQNSNADPVVTDFGFRKISNQNFSKMVALPKTALANCNCDMDKDLQVNIQLVTEGEEKYLKLTPVCEDKTENQKKKEKK